MLTSVSPLRRTGRRANAAAILALAMGLVSGALLPRGAVGETAVHFRVTRTGLVRVNLAVSDFAVRGGTGAEAGEFATAARQIVRTDLAWSGLFNQQDVHAPAPAPEMERELTALLDSLKAQGQDVYLAGDIAIEAGAPHLEARLYDVATGKLIDHWIRLVTQPDLRARAHDLSDQIVLLLTGERGIATTRIAFVSNRTGTKEIYVMDYDGENVTALTHNGSINLSPDWAPGGSLLSMVSYVRGNADIYLLHPGQPELIPLSLSPGLDSDPAFSPRGDRVVFTRGVEGNPDIYVADFADGHLANVKRLTHEPSVECCPSWAPGGGEIAFVSDRAGTPQVYVMDADGTNVHRVTFLGNYNVSPAWSPDGSRIAFASREDNNIFSIFTVQPTGEKLARLTAGGDFEDPSWSPDGRHLAVTSRREGQGSIFLLAADGSNLVGVSRGSGSDSSPAWGPWPPRSIEEAGFPVSGSTDSPPTSDPAPKAAAPSGGK